MSQMPTSVRIALLAWSSALVAAGCAFAASAFYHNLVAAAALAALFIGLAAAAPMVIGQQLQRALSEKEPALAPSPPADQLSPPKETAMPPSLPDEASLEEEAALRWSEKAHAMEYLRDGIAHDLNNRLMVISANVDVVARHLKDQPTLQRRLLSALVAADQAASLIAASSAFARQSEPRAQYVDLADHLQSVATLMSRSLLRDTVELRTSFDEELWPVCVDPDDIATALVSLSAHLRGPLSQGGAIVIEARNAHVPKGTMPSLEKGGDFVQVTLRSTFAGAAMSGSASADRHTLPAEDLNVASWLDLSQSLHFAEIIGAHADIGRTGDETAITLYLPRAQADTVLLPGAWDDDDDISAGNLADHTEILIVDDEVEVALALQSTLEEFGYAARIATNADETIKSLKTRRPGLLLIDIAMPGTMSGAMLAREVRQMMPDLPIVLITGSRLAPEGGGDFPILQKPILSRDLHAAIQRHLAPPDTSKVVSFFPRSSTRQS